MKPSEAKAELRSQARLDSKIKTLPDEAVKRSAGGFSRRNAAESEGLFVLLYFYRKACILLVRMFTYVLKIVI